MTSRHRVVSELMSRDVHSVQLGDSLNTAARLMWEHEVGCLPVVSHDGHVVGLITDRDVCMGAYTTGRTLHDVKVEQAMSCRAIACRAHETLHTAEEIMREHQVHRLPITDDAGHLVGLLTIDDLVSHFEPSYEGAARPLGGDAIAWTLFGSSRGRSRRSAAG